jgi:hypothetical protein
MKVAILAFAFLFQSYSFAGMDGRVLCTNLANGTEGFEVVEFNVKNKNFSRTTESNDLLYNASYNAYTAQFSITASTMNEDMEAVDQVLAFEGRLYKGDFLHIQSVGENPVHLYCYALY